MCQRCRLVPTQKFYQKSAGLSIPCPLRKGRKSAMINETFW
nr:MAG TPA: hypothetical protein [Caudoviricetes sp.]